MSNLGMKRITYDELSKIITKEAQNGSLGFIATVITPWHALGFESWYKDSGKNILKGTRGFVLLIPHSVTGLAVGSDHFLESSRDENVNFLVIDNSSSSMFKIICMIHRELFRLLNFNFRKRKAETVSVHIVSSLKANYRLFARLFSFSVIKLVSPNFVIVDEGIGTYKSDEFWKRLSYREGRKGGFCSLKRFLNGHYLKLLRLASKNCPHDYRFLFRKSHEGCLILNEEIAASYRELIRKHALEVVKNPSKFGSEKKALLLTQPFLEVSRLPFSTEARFFSGKISYLLSRGYKKVFIKPHPREKADIYDAIVSPDIAEKVFVLSNSIPSEILFSFLNPSLDIVVGCTSSALLTASSLFGIKAYSYGREWGKIFEAEGSFFHEDLKLFEKLTSKFVRDFSQL